MSQPLTDKAKEYAERVCNGQFPITYTREQVVKHTASDFVAGAEYASHQVQQLRDKSEQMKIALQCVWNDPAVNELLGDTKRKLSEALSSFPALSPQPDAIEKAMEDIKSTPDGFVRGNVFASVVNTYRTAKNKYDKWKADEYAKQVLDQHNIVSWCEKCEKAGGGDNCDGSCFPKDFLTQPVQQTNLFERLDAGRHYLMGTRPEDITVEDALEAFGYTRNGFEKE